LNIKRRKRLLESDAIAYFRVFLIASKNSKNNKLNIKYTNTSLPSNRLSYELSKVVRDTDLGIDFVKSINEVEKMIPSNSINNMLTMIASASKYGNKLSDSINKELDYLIDKYNHEVINRYKCIPFKYIISCLLFVVAFIIMLLIIK
jgi:archaellum biogenesis protein FlaJ (TadC family)